MELKQRSISISFTDNLMTKKVGRTRGEVSETKNSISVCLEEKKKDNEKLRLHVT